MKFIFPKFNNEQQQAPSLFQAWTDQLSPKTNKQNLPKHYLQFQIHLKLVLLGNRTKKTKKSIWFHQSSTSYLSLLKKPEGKRFVYKI